jgi:hypothetical protein
MRKILFFLLCSSGCFGFSSASAADIEMGIMTGGEEGTYYQFGQDMSKLVAQHGIKLTVLPSRGSFENILTVFDSRSAQLGLAQSDVVLFMQMSGDPKVREISEAIKVVLSLYNEEVHLLAGQDIRGLSDLAGKKVAIGRQGSGTAMTATVMLGAAEIEPAETLDLGEKQALEALHQGEIDAMFYVAGYPLKLFQHEVSADDELHLVPITDEAVIELYGTESIIPKGTYAWQNDDVPTLDITAGLMSLDYPSDDAQCGHIGRFAKLIRENLPWLQENGHPKWKSVDLDAPVAEALQFTCAVRSGQ